MLQNTHALVAIRTADVLHSTVHSALLEDRVVPVDPDIIRPVTQCTFPP